LQEHKIHSQVKMSLLKRGTQLSKDMSGVVDIRP